MCDCAGDASCVLRFCRAISLDAPKVADVRAAADCVEDLRGAAPDEVEAICAQWKVLAKGKFRRAVAALQEEVRQGADGAFDLDDAAPVTPAAPGVVLRQHNGHGTKEPWRTPGTTFRERWRAFAQPSAA